NVFNVKIHIDPDQTPTPTPKPTPTPTSKPPVPPIPPVPTASPGPPVPTEKPPDPPTTTPKETPTPGPKTRTIAGIKYWINDSATTRPDTLTVHIYNGVEEIQGSPVTLKKSTYGDSIVWPFALQTTDEGPDSNYTVAEEFPQGYENWEKYRRVSSGLYLYNYWFGDKTPIIRIRKVWKGGTPAGAKATVALRKTGSQTDLTTFELNEGNEYKAEIWMNDEDLKGLDISQITVYEKDLSGGNYKPTYTGPILSYDGDTPVYTFTVTNWPVENVRVIVEKNWIGDDETTRPQSLDVQIVRTAPDGTEMRIPFGLTKDTWKRTSTSDEEKQMPNLDEDGRQYRYSIEEESVSGYRTSVQSNRNGNTITFTLNNTWIPEEDLVNVSGFKVWEDDDDAFGLRPETIRVVVMNSRAERVSEIMELPADSAEWNVQGLPRYDEDGNKLKYYVVEEQPESYTVSYSVPFFDELNNTWVCNVYNTYSARKKVIVEKKWIPEAGIPSSLAVYLYAGDNLRASIFLNEQNHWKHVFSDLPVLDEEGNGIVYRVVEDIPDGYTGSSYLVREGLDEHFYLENRKLDAGKLAIPVEKIMTGGLIPDSEDEVFRFKLTGVEYVGISGSSDQVEKLPGDGDEITIRNEGTGAFIIPFVKEGLYFYTIQEIPGNNANITYDERSRPILIYAYRDEQTGPMQFEWGVIESSVPVVRRYVTFTNTSKQRLYTITYDPNGGIIEGDTKPVSNRYPYGKIISIHEAAVREGYLFDYWKGSVYNPGDHYTVVEDHLFIAQWISRYVNPFTFTKIWDGNPGGGLNFTVYNLDGTPTGIGFPAPTKLSENRWEYQRWFIEKPEYYVVEEAPAGYYATYSNVGEYADVTDRCYNGGTITNHQIPDTGDNANRALWAALALVSCGFLLIIFARGKRAEQRR
ncbi:MAG: Cna B-type domain-containing protein, partial [Clostridia bacterium]|nr:Cna B-type domain-containing protein [Clostridia bacterium]